MKTETVANDLKEIIFSASDLMPSHLSSKSLVETKDKNSLVTEIDKKIELHLVNSLSKLIPEAGFIAEEGTSNKIGRDYNWIIDPLDGTTNFIHGIPAYCISVGLKKGDEIIMGSIFEFVRDNYYWASQGEGSYMNGSPISVSKTPSLEDSLLATGFPYYDFLLMKEYLILLEELMPKCRGIRRLGSAALDMAFVASGKFDGFFEYSLHPWDVAAGIVLIREAGGKISDFKGSGDFLFGKEMLATNGLIHKELFQIIQAHFGN